MRVRLNQHLQDQDRRMESIQDQHQEDEIINSQNIEMIGKYSNTVLFKLENKQKTATAKRRELEKQQDVK